MVQFLCTAKSSLEHLDLLRLALNILVKLYHCPLQNADMIVDEVCEVVFIGLGIKKRAAILNRRPQQNRRRQQNQLQQQNQYPRQRQKLAAKRSNYLYSRLL